MLDWGGSESWGSLGWDKMSLRNIELRHLARESLSRAKHELASGEIERLKYAALELRLAIEAVIYDKARLYEQDLTRSDYEKWQPKKLMLTLLEINPYADQSGTLSIGEETGASAPKMIPVGTEVSLSLKNIKEHYDALGSFLHMPSLRQLIDDAKPSPDAVRMRCGRIVDILERVLSSRLFNISMGSSSEIDCDRCGARLLRRLPLGGEGRRMVSCHVCGAGYELVGSKGDTRWYLEQEKVECTVENCDGKIAIWKSDIKVGNIVNCSKCASAYVVVMGLNKI